MTNPPNPALGLSTAQPFGADPSHPSEPANIGANEPTAGNAPAHGAETAAFGAPSAKSALKSKILADIAAHVRIHGRCKWDQVRENPEYAHLIGKEAGANGKRMFWRWVSAVCEPTPPDKTRPHEARVAAADALHSATGRAREAAQQNLPAAPSPAYLMRAGAGAAKNIDFLAAVYEIWADAERLREHAMGLDENSPDGKCINDPKLFDASIHRRIEVMEAALRVMQEIWDLEYQQRFYDGITEIIVGELASVPEIQERVIRRLAELNKRRGMTVHAEVG